MWLTRTLQITAVLLAVIFAPAFFRSLAPPSDPPMGLTVSHTLLGIQVTNDRDTDWRGCVVALDDMGASSGRGQDAVFQGRLEHLAPRATVSLDYGTFIRDGVQRLPVGEGRARSPLVTVECVDGDGTRQKNSFYFPKN